MDTTGKRRLCLFCETWASGGIESFLFNVLTHADLTGLEVDLVAAQIADSVFAQPLEALGVRFVELSGSVRKVGENHRRFRQLLEQWRYDVVWVNAYQALSLAYLRLAKEAAIPVRIAHSHNTALRKSLTRPLKLALHRWSRLRFGACATHRWACSTPAARFLFGGRDFRFIPNGIDTARFRFDPQLRQQVRRELGWENTLVMGNVGRLCYQKNQDFLLDVFSAVHKARPDSRLLLVGRGDDRPALEKKARSLGLENAVCFYGVTDQVEQLFWAMDLFLFPSRFEGLGIVAVEAQASGLPVLCSTQVPPEAAVTDRVSRLELRAGPGPWARQALDTQPVIDRDAAADQVAAAGFEVRSVAAEIEKIWRG